MEEEIENSKDVVYFKSFSYDDYEKRLSEDGNTVELYYKEYFIYQSLKEDDFVEEIYHTPTGEFQVDAIPSAKQQSIKFIPNEFLEEEHLLVIEIDKKLSKLKEGSFRYALVEREYSKKTNSVLLSIAGTTLVEEDNEKWKEFKKLEKRYSILNFALPYLSIKDILEDLVEDIVQYTVSRNFDSSLFSSYLESLKIAEFTSSSANLLENFINDPHSCDIENLLRKLTNSIHNIDYIIKINTTDLDKETVKELDL